MRVLVTGASGMLGRAVAQTIGRNGHTVTVLQRRPSGLDYAEIQGDITDQQVVRSAVKDQQAVIHLAARVSPAGRWRDFADVNIGGTSNLINASQQAGVTRFVYVSSPSVASSGKAHIGESALPADPASTRSYYARSKAEAEQLVLARAGGEMAVTAVRPHLVWGPGDEQLVARVVRRATSGSLRLIGSGAALVDSTYVDNAADALAAALDQAPAIDGQALVISNGEPRPVTELLRGLCDAAGFELPMRCVPTWAAKAGGALVEAVWAAGRLTTDPPMTRFLAEQLSTAHWYDQRLTRELLDWTPTVSIDDGLARLADWYR
ncbi:MAG: NAD-dependent epimerase/dehydratase family protein [Acidimicrobiales bacterium]